MKHPPKFLWVSYCTRCGDIVAASKRAGGRMFCPFCVGATVVKAARYRLHTAPGKERQ